jgi:hypothetical protein
LNRDVVPFGDQSLRAIFLRHATTAIGINRDTRDNVNTGIPLIPKEDLGALVDAIREVAAADRTAAGVRESDEENIRQVYNLCCEIIG